MIHKSEEIKITCIILHVHSKAHFMTFCLELTVRTLVLRSAAVWLELLGLSVWQGHPRPPSSFPGLCVLDSISCVCVCRVGRNHRCGCKVPLCDFACVWCAPGATCLLRLTLVFTHCHLPLMWVSRTLLCSIPHRGASGVPGPSASQVEPPGETGVIVPSSGGKVRKRTIWSSHDFGCKWSLENPS